MAGTYGNGNISIDFINGKLKGQFLNRDTQIFTGIIDSNCTGTMNISDIGTNSFQYDEKEYTIFWKDQTKTREKWVKGKNFYNLRFFENKYLFH